MASPARLHKQREEARIASERAAERQETLQGSEHELALAQLAQHKRQLQGIQSLEARQAKKAELMQEWHGYIDGVLAADAGVPDPIISQMLPWLFDVGDIDRALTVGDYLLRHDLPAPESFARSAPALYAELAAEAWLVSIRAPSSGATGWRVKAGIRCRGFNSRSRVASIPAT